MQYNPMCKELTLNDRKQVQLEMLIEIDAFCREHNIKYALSCGTLIGAIRHKGFIPWDDDVDITMPYKDMVRFKETFKSETIKYCDIDTEPGYAFHFSRLANTRTYRRFGKVAIDYGICIDVYPVIKCTEDVALLDKQIGVAKRIFKKRRFYTKWRNRLLKLLPVPLTNLPLYTHYVKKYRDYFITEMQVDGGSGGYYQLGGPLDIFFKNYWTFNPFEKLIEVDFEGYKFLSPERYDEFLTVRYGDYMKLPPVENRVPYHGGKYYWK